MGDIELFDIEKEYDLVINRIAGKHGYDEKFKQLLKKVTGAMLKGRSYEERKVFYEMLNETPIYVVRKSEMDKKEAEVFGSINPHIKTETAKETVYKDLDSEGFYKREPILDENLNIVGRKQAIFLPSRDLSQNLSEQEKARYELFGTGINVSHLIHELGHAWYTQRHNIEKVNENTIISNVGIAIVESHYEKDGEGQYICTEDLPKLGMIEEGMNTELEEEALKRFLNIDDNKLKELYSSSVLISNNYQKLVLAATSAVLNRGLRKEFEKLRMFGDEKSKDRIEQSIGQTESYKERCSDNESLRNREMIISMLLNGQEISEDGTIQSINPEKKSRIENRQRVGRMCEEDFIGDRSDMSPIEYVDNILTYLFDVNAKNTCFNFSEYPKVIRMVTPEINQLLDDMSREEPSRQEASKED